MSIAIIRNEFFGALRFDERRRSYEAEMEFTPGRKIAVTIDSIGIEPGEAFARSRHIYSTVARREPEYRRAVASQLLPLYNRSWRNGEALHAGGFMERLSVESVTIAPVELGHMGCVTLYYDDGGLFAGHLIEVFLDADFRYSNAQLAG